MPLVLPLFHAQHQVESSQRLSIGASQLCSRAEGGHRGMSGVPGHCQSPPQITHHGDSPCPHAHVPAVPPAAWAPAPGYLHKLQILEGRELSWDLSELVSIQVAAREDKSTSGRLRSRRSLPLLPLSPVHHHGLWAARSISSITSLLHPGPKGLSGDSWAGRGASVRVHEHTWVCRHVPGDTLPAASVCQHSQPRGTFTHPMGAWEAAAVRKACVSM